MKRGILLLVATLAGTTGAFAQQSVSFKMEEHVFNAAGHPAQGTTMQSASYRMGLDSLGEGLSRGGLASAQFRMDAGFVGAYRHGDASPGPLPTPAREPSPRPAAESGTRRGVRDTMSLGITASHLTRTPGRTLRHSSRRGQEG